MAIERPRKIQQAVDLRVGSTFGCGIPIKCFIWLYKKVKSQLQIGKTKKFITKMMQSPKQWETFKEFQLAEIVQYEQGGSSIYLGTQDLDGWVEVTSDVQPQFSTDNSPIYVLSLV